MIKPILLGLIDWICFPLPCRFGYHRWETPPYFPMFAEFSESRVYEQCTRIGCWKIRNEGG